MIKRTELEWTETREGSWFASNAEFYIWQEWAAIGGKCWVLSNDDWHGLTMGPGFPTPDEAKARAQRIQDAIDGYDRLEEVRAKIEKYRRRVCDDSKSDAIRCGKLIAIETVLDLLRETR